MKKKIFIITIHFPYKRGGENSFIEPELKYLTENYDVTIISTRSPKLAKKGPKDARLYGAKHYCFPWAKTTSGPLFFKLSKTFFSKLYWREVFSLIVRGKDVIKSIRSATKEHMMAVAFEKWVRDKGIIKPEDEGVFYSYWYRWVLLGMAKKKNEYPNLKLVTRAHRFDLFDGDDFVDNYDSFEHHYFRPFLDKKLDSVIFVSNSGKDYYLSHQAKSALDSRKYVVSYLGQEFHEAPAHIFSSSLKDEKHKFTLASCSYVITRKRVTLIAEALQHAGLPLRWIHFGDGPELEHLKELANEAMKAVPGLEIELKGYVNNDEVLGVYASGEVDAFILTSCSEGLPVSISEAMSFGLPIIATGVDGIPEQIDGNGILLSAEPDANEVSEALKRIFDMSDAERKALGRKSRGLWEERFEARKNTEKLCDIFRGI